MGTVDIEQTVNEILQSDSDNLNWDGETPTYEEMEQIIRKVVTEVTECHYSMNDGETDDL